MVGPADHRAHSPYAIDGHQGGLLRGRVLEAGDGGPGGGAGRIFHNTVQRGLHGQVAGQLRNHLAHLAVHPVHEILRGAGGGALPDPRLLGGGLVALGRRDGAGFGHGVQHQPCPLLRALRLFGRIVGGGRLQHPGQHGGFLDRQLRRRLVEEPLRGGLDPVRARPEIDPAEIEPQDLRLGIALLDLHRIGQLGGLPLQGPRLAEEQVAGQLLGDRRRALRRAPLADPGHHGARDAARVKTGVLIEPPVLDGHKGGGHMFRQSGDVDRRRVASAPHPGQTAVAVEIGDLRLALDGGQTRQLEPLSGELQNGGKGDQSRLPGSRSLKRVRWGVCGSGCGGGQDNSR